MSLNHYIEQIIEHTGIDRNKVFDGVVPKKEYTASDLLKIAENLRVHPIKLFQKDIDLDDLCSSSSAVPKKYRTSMYSSSTSVRSVIEEFDKNNRAQDALLYLGLDKSILSEKRPISILAVNDALMFMSKLLSYDNLVNIAQRNADAFLKTEFGNKFKDRLKSDGPVAAFFENTKYIEKNWQYAFQKYSDCEYKVTTSQSDEMLDEVPGSNFTNGLTNSIRMEFIKHVIESTGMHCQFSQISEIGKHGKVSFNLKLQHLHQPIHLFQ